MASVWFPFVGMAGVPDYYSCMMSTAELQRQPRHELRSFLRDLRGRLVSPRRGRAVSQEEFAEWVGVSRNWYAALERGEPINPSISVVARVAEALNATTDERAKLFQLAIPALRGVL